MSRRPQETALDALRREATQAVEEGRSAKVVEPLLEKLVRLAPEGDPARTFAHKHLAELRLERDPWSAALHLRRAIAAEPLDDMSLSLMALAQALLGNYRAAVASYRRALRVQPDNPWYHHNLGHLIDVALDEPARAIGHLESAHAGVAPADPEILASLAHCVARLGDLERARALAEDAVTLAPGNPEHVALRDWIARGAPSGEAVYPLRSGTGQASTPSMNPGASSEDTRSTLTDGRGLAAFVTLLSQHLVGPEHAQELRVASAIAAAFANVRRVDRLSVPVTAASLHYAAVAVIGASGPSQATLAELYGVSEGALSKRFRDIRTRLGLAVNDDRFR